MGITYKVRVSEENFYTAERERATERWEKCKSSQQRKILYNKIAPNLAKEDYKYIIDLERLYMDTFSDWEDTYITDEQYNILKDYLPIEYFLNVIAIYIGVRHNDFPLTIEELKSNSFLITDKDKKCFENYLKWIYLPAIIEFIEKCGTLRTTYEIYKDIQNTDVIKDDTKEITYYEFEKVAVFLYELENNMHLFFVCLENNLATLTEDEGQSLIFGDLFENSEKPKGEDPKAESAANAERAIQKYAMNYPTAFKIGNSLLENNMNVGIIPYTGRDEAYKLDVSGKKSKSSENILVSLVPDDESVELSKPLTPFDIAVLDCVATLINSGITAFTPAMIYRVMRGFDGTGNMKDYDSQDTICHIEQSLEKARHIWARIDYTEQAQKREKTKAKVKENGKSYIIDGYLLQCTRAAAKINGKLINSAYIAIGQPPLYMYNMAVKQILTIPSKLLDLKGIVNVNERTMLIARYLLRRIYTANHGQGYRISFDALCREIGESTATDKQRRNIKSTSEKILSYWSTNKDVKEISPLKGYSLYKVGKKISGFTINIKNT